MLLSQPRPAPATLPCGEGADPAGGWLSRAAAASTGQHHHPLPHHTSSSVKEMLFCSPDAQLRRRPRVTTRPVRGRGSDKACRSGPGRADPDGRTPPRLPKHSPLPRACRRMRTRPLSGRAAEAGPHDAITTATRGPPRAVSRARRRSARWGAVPPLPPWLRPGSRWVPGGGAAAAVAGRARHADLADVPEAHAGGRRGEGGAGALPARGHPLRRRRLPPLPAPPRRARPRSPGAAQRRRQHPLPRPALPPAGHQPPPSPGERRPETVTGGSGRAGWRRVVAASVEPQAPLPQQGLAAACWAWACSQWSLKPCSSLDKSRVGAS